MVSWWWRRQWPRKWTVGVILMVVGAVGFVISTIVFAVSRRPVGGRRQAYDRETVDAQGRSTEVHEKTK